MLNRSDIDAIIAKLESPHADQREKAAEELQALGKVGLSVDNGLKALRAAAQRFLAAILFPVFAQARDKARQTSCLSNLRQISMGFSMYIQDHNEQFPFIRGDLSWVYTMQPYLKSTQILRCPSDDSVNWKEPLAVANTIRATSYTLNGFLAQVAPTTRNPNPAPNPYATLGALQSPASVIYLAESARNFTENYFHAHIWSATTPVHWDTARNLPDDLTVDRHSGGFNAGFVDGHAKWVRWSQVWWQNPPIEKGSFDPRQ